jgi:hypothetical protein
MGHPGAAVCSRMRHPRTAATRPDRVQIAAIQGGFKTVRASADGIHDSKTSRIAPVGLAALRSALPPSDVGQAARGAFCAIQSRAILSPKPSASASSANRWEGTGRSTTRSASPVRCFTAPRHPSRQPSARWSGDLAGLVDPKSLPLDHRRTPITGRNLVACFLQSPAETRTVKPIRATHTPAAGQGRVDGPPIAFFVPQTIRRRSADAGERLWSLVESDRCALM